MLVELVLLAVDPVVEWISSTIALSICFRVYHVLNPWIEIEAKKIGNRLLTLPSHARKIEIF